MRKFIVLLFFVFVSVFAQAQEKIEITERDYTNEKVEMADQFRKEGKIYVLTGIICIILGGIFLYLIAIDKKVGRLEKQLPDHDL